MPLNPNIPLAGQQQNLVQALSQGFQAGDAIHNAPLTRALMEQRQQMGQQQIGLNEQSSQLNTQNLELGTQNLETGALNLETAQTQKAVSDLQISIPYAMQIRSRPAEERVAYYNDFVVPELGQFGINAPAQTAADFTDEALDADIATGNEIITNALSASRTPPNFQQAQGSNAVDEDGRRFRVTPTFNPGTGQTEMVTSAVDGTDNPPRGRLTGANAEWQTPDMQTASAVDEAGQIELQNITMAAGEAALTSLEGANNNMALYDEALAALDAGANTGWLVNRFPTINAATLALENVQARLGLNVIANTTFGALSESELAFALDSTIPLDMEEEDLRIWLAEKKRTQGILADYQRSAGQYLLTPRNTITDWISIQERNQAASQSTLAPGTTPMVGGGDATSTQTRAQQILDARASGNSRPQGVPQ